MIMFRLLVSFTFFIFLFALLVVGVGEWWSEPDSSDSFTARVARWFSPELRRIEERLADVAGEQEKLPELRPQPFASRFGYRSATLESQEEPHWVQIDLLENEKIDRIVAMPVNIPLIGSNGVGYGFPLRFKIEVADNPEMEDAVMVADETSKDVKNPGRYPVNFRLKGVKGRYVRFTSTKHFFSDEGFMWALEELLVLSGNRNVSILKKVQRSSSMELYPNWAWQRLVDGHSALQMPVSKEISMSRGYMSAESNQARVNKWLIIDLESEFEIDEIRLLPVEKDNFQNQALKSFPRGYSLELARDAEFKDVTWAHPYNTSNLVGYPGGCAEVLQVLGKRGRYIRIKAKEVWGAQRKFSYAFSELQAYAGNLNVAIGKTVSASDVADVPKSSGWFPEALVDGFTARHRLIELPDYLDLIERRGILEQESERLILQKEAKVRMTGQVLLYGGSGSITILAFGWCWVILRQRSMREQAMEQLREQIARDLHDDIGSNLGGIAILSKIGTGSSTDAQSREDFQMIKIAADEAAASMRDIVWLIQKGHFGLRDLVAKIRQSADMILGDEQVSLKVEPVDFNDRNLSLLFRRHVLFAFKETLNNIRKHADATEVVIFLLIDPTHFTFTICDDGVGFDTKYAELPGHGLANLVKRAERLNGTCKIESRPSSGSTITFTAPLKS